MYEVYTMQSGDTLESIATRYGTTVEVLRQINGLANDFVGSSGMMIVVPMQKEQPYQYYTVKKGDNLTKISKEYGVDYNLLLQLNGLDPNDYIYPNQTILIPKKDYQIYMTSENDTLKDVIKRFGVTVDELMKENDKIYLRPEQIIVFRQK